MHAFGYRDPEGAYWPHMDQTIPEDKLTEAFHGFASAYYTHPYFSQASKSASHPTRTITNLTLREPHGKSPKRTKQRHSIVTSLGDLRVYPSMMQSPIPIHFHFPARHMRPLYFRTHIESRAPRTRCCLIVGRVGARHLARRWHGLGVCAACGRSWGTVCVRAI